MHPKIFQHFKLNIKQEKQKCYITAVLDKMENKKNFTYPATNKKAKIYIVKDKNEIIYIGITTQSIGSRLRYGLNPIIKYGYHGYKWRNLKQIDLLVWSDSGRDKATENSLKLLECLEAEIVYLFRKNMGRWPAYQTEIHFYNCSEQQKIFARAIYTIASKRKSNFIY